MPSSSGNGSSTDTPNRIVLVDNEVPSVSFLEADSLEKIKTLELPPLPHEVIVDEDAGIGYVCVTYKDGYYKNNEEAATFLQLVDIEKMELTDLIDVSPHYAPHGMDFSPDRGTLYVTCESNGGEIIAVDLESQSVVGEVGVEADGPHWMAVLPDGSKAYTANKEAPFVSVVDLKAMEKVGEIPTPSGTEGITATRDGKEVFISSQRSPEVYVIDTATDEITRKIDIGEGFPGALAATHDDRRILLTHFNFEYWKPGNIPQPGFLQVIDRETGEVSAPVEVGRFPINVASDRGDRRAYVTCYPDHTINVVDLQELKVVAREEVATGPHGFALLYPSGD